MTHDNFSYSLVQVILTKTIEHGCISTVLYDLLEKDESIY